ncbi:type I-F CRISPR-associated helicase Cas3f [Shewanella electrodiphila]|uniref:Type I-F CRISPR-associated helicase Cas3f n=1 Tax=Shewanella electrodiphila TaxID=934143 RepID=A0ABT0KUM5_9GAMM|nr:type I-F CRISPR-associated helicase Cas3f [Shewanella electrodiphila]MCL1047541.1 type I-F CRISPR-associated helicase Cas3f [Shewanella electrodiphila]
MMVTFVSQCEKNALKKTRRVLDAFANRIGDNTWQTLITEDGLLSVKKLLRKTASRSTAVSCHWIRSRSRSQFLWVVGNKSKFNCEGVVPVNRTKRNLLNMEIENDWKYLPLIKSLTGLAALLHDWGKASLLFQNKLSPYSRSKFKGDPIRHEWISCLLLNALVKSSEADNKDWLKVFITGELDEQRIKAVAGVNIGNPLKGLPNEAKLIAWLIVSHHRLPLYSWNKKEVRNKYNGEYFTQIDDLLSEISKEWGYENRQDEVEYQSRVKQCFEFPKGLLTESKPWHKSVRRWATQLQYQAPLVKEAIADGSYRLVLHHARLCLMLGDHNYSSQGAAKGWQDSTGLFANTDRDTNQFKQKLDEHLVGVAKVALDTAHLLPAFESEPPLAQDIQALRKPSPKAFRWQDKAVDSITTWQQQQSKQSFGFFAVNMASTGCGKTFANAKVMRALSSDQKSLRYILALGLRTLTLQTGDEYRQRIGLDKSQLAVLIGSKVVADLHNKRAAEEEELTAEAVGSESAESLLDEFIDYDCDIPEAGLTTVLTKHKDKQFLYAPVLACTIDHIMAATETKRGGRYILPSLRLMSSDLVIDEIDDFTGSDLIAIGRLIHLAGMLGRKVMISSATIPPSLAEGYFNAYKKGWQLYCKSRTESQPIIGCAWIDESYTEVETVNSNDSNNAITQYRSLHDGFIDKRIKLLASQSAKRKGHIVTCATSMVATKSEDETSKQEAYFQHIKDAVLVKHQHHHTIDELTDIQVSFGVVRVANISPCVELTRYLLKAEFPAGTEVKAMAYHSQQVLLLRHEQEQHLDQVLKRKEKAGEAPKAFSNAIIRDHLDNSSAKKIIFILVATPVEEVGRDHDFDWAVVEPSSYRSIVQLAGRVRRHREGEVEQPNIGLMQYNYKAYKEDDKKGGVYFTRPGYEAKPMPTHDLNKLINLPSLEKGINAIPRITPLDKSHGQHLAGIEHRAISTLLTQYTQLGPQALQGYLDSTWFLTALPQLLHEFRQSEPSNKIYLVVNSDDEDCYFTQKDEQGIRVTDIYGDLINIENILQIVPVSLSNNERNSLWLLRDYVDALDKYIDEDELSTRRQVSLRYGELSFAARDNDKYEYSDQFGLVKIGRVQC